LDFLEEMEPLRDSFFSTGMFPAVADPEDFSFFDFDPKRLPKMLRLFFLDEEVVDSLVELASLVIESVGDTRLTLNTKK